MKQINYKKLILPNIPYLFIGLFATKLGQAARLSPGVDFSSKVLNMMDGISMAFENILPSFHPVDLLVGTAAAVIIRLVVYFKGKNAKKFRKNLEYGSARWGNREDIAPFVDPVFENNIILTQTERLMMSNRPKEPKNARNKNVLVVGGSGSGKTRFFVKPQLMQLHSSYVVTDPKGSVVCEVGKLLERNHYKIKIFNTINFKKSMHYMDSRIFLGGSEPTTLKELNQSLGKETIDTFNTGESRGREVSHSLNYQKLGKDLATIDELAVLDGGKCILQLRGVRPFLSDKFDITKHPNYKYLSDASPKNNFDIEKYLSTRLKTKPDDVYEVYEVDASDESATA